MLDSSLKIRNGIWVFNRPTYSYSYLRDVWINGEHHLIALIAFCYKERRWLPKLLVLEVTWEIFVIGWARVEADLYQTFVRPLPDLVNLCKPVSNMYQTCVRYCQTCVRSWETLSDLCQTLSTLCQTCFRPCLTRVKLVSDPGRLSQNCVRSYSDIVRPVLHLCQTCIWHVSDLCQIFFIHVRTQVQNPWPLIRSLSLGIWLSRGSLSRKCFFHQRELRLELLSRDEKNWL